MKPNARLVTIREAAELTPLSEPALRARVERGSIPSELVGTRRMVPLDALYELGLIPLSPGATVRDLLDRLERQAERIGELEAELRRRSTANDS